MPLASEEMVEILSEFGEVEEVVPLRGLVMRALELCDIHAAYFVAPLSSDPRIGRLLTNIGLPRVWERYYRSRLQYVDPLPTLSLDFSNAFYWPDELDADRLTGKQRKYMRIAAQYGLARGIGVACYGPRGRAGFLGTAWAHDDPPSARVLQAVHQIGQTSFQRYCRIMREDIDIDPLSNRELEVLGWMCQGKSNPDMATIIGVSRSSIDAYIRRIFAKLNVKDRTAACVRAYALGLVESEEIMRLIEKARQRDGG